MANQYYVNPDAQGKISRRYASDIHTPEQIPETAIEITETQWLDSMANPRKYRIIESQWVERTQQEIDQEIADEAAQPRPESAEQKIQRLEMALARESELRVSQSTDFQALTDLLAETGMI